MILAFISCLVNDQPKSRTALLFSIPRNTFWHYNDNPVCAQLKLVSLLLQLVMENCDRRRDRRISTKTTGDCYLRWSTARISGELAEKVTVSRRCPAFLRHPRSSCSGNMMLRALPPLRRLECASHSQCFGDTRQASTTWTWSDLTKKRDFL